jgi:hypothetical protein
MSRRDAVLLRVFAIWTIWVWSTRIYNIIGDDHRLGFKIVHSLLAAVSVVLAIVALIVVSRNRRQRIDV